jgi:hypothetical protein
LELFKLWGTDDWQESRLVRRRWFFVSCFCTTKKTLLVVVVVVVVVWTPLQSLPEPNQDEGASTLPTLPSSV